MFNGGPAQRDETADELWFRQKCCDENKGSPSSLRASVYIRGAPQSLNGEMSNEVHLLHSAIYFRGKVFGCSAADENPSERRYQVASGQSHLLAADNKSLLALRLWIQSRRDLKAAKRLWWLELFTSHFPLISPPAACLRCFLHGWTVTSRQQSSEVSTPTAHTEETLSPAAQEQTTSGSEPE